MNGTNYGNYNHFKLIAVPSIKRHVAELVGYSESLAHNLEMIDKRLKSIEATFEEVLDVMYNRMTIRLLRDSDIAESLLMEYLMSPELSTDLPKLITKECKDRSSKLPQQQFTTLARLVCNCYSLIQT